MSEVRWVTRTGSTTILEQDSGGYNVTRFGWFLIFTGAWATVFALSIFLSALFTIAVAGTAGLATWNLIKKFQDHEAGWHVIGSNKKVLTWHNSPVKEKEYLKHFIYNEALQDLFLDTFGPEPTGVDAWDKTFIDLNNKMASLELERKNRKKEEIPNYLDKFNTFEKLMNGELPEDLDADKKL